MRLNPAFLTFGLALGLCAWPLAASARPSYPQIVDGALDLDCGTNSSRCLMCHATAAGGRNTATRPFAVALSELGFEGDTDPQILVGLLAPEEPLAVGGEPSVSAPGEASVLSLSQRDSDEDGTSDLDELMACGNPSGDEYGVPEYGCDGGSIVPGASPRTGSWGLVVLFALACLARAQPRRLRSSAPR